MESPQEPILPPKSKPFFSTPLGFLSMLALAGGIAAAVVVFGGALQKGSTPEAESTPTFQSTPKPSPTHTEPAPAFKAEFPKKDAGVVTHTSKDFPPMVPNLVVPKDPPANKPLTTQGSIDVTTHNQIIEELQKVISQQKMSIEELNATVLRIQKQGGGMNLTTLKKPKALYVAECYGMEVGQWGKPPCAKGLEKKLKEALTAHPTTIVWEVVPVVDTMPYKGDRPELKQEGLGSFRAGVGLEVLRGVLGKETVAFKGMTLQEPHKRGFVLKLYYLEP